MRWETSGVALAVAVVVVVSTAGAASAGFGALFPQTGSVSPDSVALRADVHEDGSATWRIEYRVRLATDSEAEAFENLSADVARNESEYSDRFERRMGATIDAAANATGREMRLENVTVEAQTQQLPEQYGVVRYRFEWVGFAAVDGERLRIGDALAGFFLTEDTHLVLAWPSDYEVRTVQPEPTTRDDASVTWVGPRDFGSGEPRVVVARPGPLSEAGPFVGLFVALVAGAGTVWLFRDRLSPLVPAADDERVDDERADDGEAAESSHDVPEELLSPEERVVRLIEDRGGRVRQQEVVSELDWTAARTSQVVGALREEGTVETFRLGRENVLTLTDEEGDASESGEDGETD